MDLLRNEKEENKMKIDKTLDLYRNLSAKSLYLLPESEILKAGKVINRKRMEYLYSRNNLMNATEYGIYYGGLPCQSCHPDVENIPK